jgi:hypothetical protein
MATANGITLKDRYVRVVATKGNEKKEYTQALKIEFKVQDFGDAKLNELELSITNLNESSRKFFEESRYKIDIELYAGYQATNGLIFKGTTETANINDRKGEHITGFKKHDSTKNETDWITTVKAKDGIKQTKNNVFSMSIKDSTNLSSVINKLGDHIGLEKGTISTKGLNKQYLKGFSASGNAWNHINGFAGTHGYKVKSTKGVLHFWKIGTPVNDTVIVLDETSGLILSPEQTERGLKVKSLLRHEFNIGHIVKIDSLYKKGYYLIEKVTHKGDTWSNDWYSELELITYDK